MTQIRSAEPAQLREVRRPITSIFIDVVGSTPLSVLLDDDVYSSVINQYRLLVGNAVRRHGGTVEHDEGDGRFVWFGWPSAHRDDADRAVRMALELFDGIRPLAERVRALADWELTLRIGIHTGPQLVSLPAGNQPPDVRGGAANFAAKVQQRCDPGMLLISEATVDALTQPFQLVPEGVVTVDALPGGIRVFRVLGPGDAPANAGVYVGRERELAWLQERWARVAGGGAAAVAITAPAGMGKSRLLSELCARCEMPLVIHAVGDERRREDPLYALVHGLGRAGLLAAGMAPESVDDVVGLLEMATAGGPTAFVVDDAQWLDASSRDVVAALATNPPEHLMLIVASPPGAALRWPEDGDRLQLAPLTPEAAALLLEGVDELPARGTPAHELLIERGGGNPLFLRWLARSGAGADFEGVRRILRPRSGVPIVLQQVLRSVLDGTGVDEVTTSTAAAIGAEFDAALLAAVLDRPQERVDEDLRVLAAYEVIRRADAGAGRFRFSHGLVRDLAYDLLVHDEQLRCHARIADTLEAGESTDDALIGYHHDRAGRPEPAARSKLRAARACRASGAYREGAALTGRALELLGTGSGTVDVDLQLEANELHHLFATVTEPRAYAAGAQTTPTELLAEMPADEQARWACIEKTSQWAAACMVGDLRRSAGLLYDVYRLGAVHVPTIRPFNQCARGYQATMRGNYAHAERLLRESTARMLAVGIDPWMAEHWPAPDDPIALGFAYLPAVLLQRGYLRSGVDWLRRAWQRAETVENGAYSMAHISLYSALFWAGLGDGQAVMEHGRDMAKLGEELHAGLWTTLGGIYEQLGAALADPRSERARDLGGLASSFETMAGPLAIVLYLYAGEAAVAARDTQLAGELLEGVSRLSSSLGLKGFDAEAGRLRAATLAGAERATALVAAAGLASRQGARRYRLRAVADLVELEPASAAGKGSPASVLASALAEMPEQDGDPDVKRARALLSTAGR